MTNNGQPQWNAKKPYTKPKISQKGEELFQSRTHTVALHWNII